MVSNQSMSDVKNWVFLILLINLILLPAMWLAQSKSTGGQVLGVREAETKESINPDNNSNSGSNLSSWIGENIFSARAKPITTNNSAIDTGSMSSELPLRTNVNKTITTKSLMGKVVVREGFKGTLAARDFFVGDRVTLKCGDKVTITSVDTSILTNDAVLAVASNSVFIQLGVDPTQIKELQCVISRV